MSFKETVEDKIQKSEKRLLELSLTMKRLDREYQQVLKDLALNPEQIKAYAENPDNFSPPIWEMLQKEKQQRDEKLNFELNNVSDLLKAKKQQSERAQVQKHWLFVR